MKPCLKRVLDTYRDIERRGHIPTVRELGDECGLRSSSTVHHHLRSLKALGHDLPTRGPIALREYDAVITSFVRDLRRAVRRGIISKTEVTKVHNQLKEKLKCQH